MKGVFGNMITQMQQNIQKAQEELQSKEVSGESGAGLVKINMNGKYSATSVDIDPSLLQEDKDLLEDLVAAAINDAVLKIQRAQQECFSGLGLPENFKMPF